MRNLENDILAGMADYLDNDSAELKKTASAIDGIFVTAASDIIRLAASLENTRFAVEAESIVNLFDEII